MIEKKFEVNEGVLVTYNTLNALYINYNGYYPKHLEIEIKNLMKTMIEEIEGQHLKFDNPMEITSDKLIRKIKLKEE